MAPPQAHCFGSRTASPLLGRLLSGRCDQHRLGQDRTHLYTRVTSFRIEAATTAAAAGIQAATIKILGRWQSTAYLQYQKNPTELLLSHISLHSRVRSARKYSYLTSTLYIGYTLHFHGLFMTYRLSCLEGDLQLRSPMGQLLAIAKSFDQALLMVYPAH